MKKVMPSVLFVIATLAASLAPASTVAEEERWPRQIPTQNGSITIYQPQFESMKGDSLRVRAAVSYQRKDAKEPVFGVTWLLVKVRTDRDARTATLSAPLVERTRFPEITAEQEKKFAAAVNPKIAQWPYAMSLDAFTGLLSAAEREQTAADDLKGDPPKILVRKETSVLLLVDGDPILESIPNTNLKCVVNTPAAMLTDGTQFYTSNGMFWYAAPAVKGPWAVIPKPPADVEKVAQEALAKAPKRDDADAKVPGTAPNLVVATEPTELISFDGEPKWDAITGTGLHTASNTVNKVFRDVASRDMIVLLAGRWYRSKSFDGPWTFVPADRIPAGFAKIPAESSAGDVRPSVPGTTEAEDAVLDAQIPQTQAVDRKSAKLEVQYDGAPKFEPIPGAGLEYALNSSTSVLKARGGYYACDQGVWYVSEKPDGPWTVSDQRPSEVDDIPPASPVYNTKYVYVYDSTPTVVYVGYTPGYVGCYPWGPTVVWGTGYPYVPWYGIYYYPRPVTFGMSVHYNPWTGWSMGEGWSNGFMRFGMSWNVGGGYYHGGGWFGPGGYRPVSVNVGSGSNLYNRPRNKARNAPNAKLPDQRRDAPMAQNRPGTAGKTPATHDAPPSKDVFAGTDGNVYSRGSGGGFNSKTGSSGSPDASTIQGLQRDAAARDHGNARAQSYQRSNPAPSVNREGGGRRP